MSLIRNPKEFGSGLLFAGFGLAAIVIGSAYPVGTAARMGPGYFPRGLGMILVALGAILIFHSLRKDGGRIAIKDLRPLLIVLGSVVLFGLVALATWAIQLRWWKGQFPELPELVTDKHYHDIGKVVFAFTAFWGYLTFSQFVIIWYGKLAEERPFFTLRRFRCATGFLTPVHVVPPSFANAS